MPTLITQLRITIGSVAAWTHKSTRLVEVWQRGLYQPKPEDRARLVTEVRNHATTLLALADTVEREGQRKEP